jgi:hypothetical protein
MTSLVITKDNFDTIRSEGIGNGFKVANPADGFRKDNRLWFGTCETCGERVTNSALTGKGWEHNLILETTYHADGKSILSQTSRNIDYCPMA